MPDTFLLSTDYTICHYPTWYSHTRG